VNAAGVPAQRLPFEMMTLYELVSAMQSTTVCQPLSAEFAIRLDRMCMVAFQIKVFTAAALSWRWLKLTAA